MQDIEIIFIVVIVLQLLLFCYIVLTNSSHFDNNERSGAGTYKLLSNQKLKAGEFLIERRNGNHKLVMQHDGNLVLYNIKDNKNTPIWSTGTYTHGNDCYLAMENNNLVVYNKYNKPIWSTNIPKKPFSSKYFLGLEQDTLFIGNNTRNILWANNLMPLNKYFGILLMNQRLNAGESIKNESSTLTMQHDGNLVLYNGNNIPIWSSQSSGQGINCYAILQTDNNFVIYNRNNKPIWNSGTSNKGTVGEATLRIERDSFTIYSNYDLIWKSS
jgi:hypothetical protein